jgi:hypothetical protein
MVFEGSGGVSLKLSGRRSTVVDAIYALMLLKWQMDRLDKFYMQCVRWICRVNRYILMEHHVSSAELLQRCGFQPLRTVIISTVIRWLGHVARMPNSRLPKQLLFGHLMGITGPVSNSGGKLRSWYWKCLNERKVGRAWYHMAQDRKL